MVLATSQQEFSDADFRIVDNADQSKKAAFEASGIATATTRTFTLPNASGTIALTSDLTSGYQPLDSDLTSWAAITRASGFDTFVATPSSANFASMITDELGSGSVALASVGSWTPSLGGTTTYIVRSARYIRIANWCMGTARILINAIGTGSQTTISGLPFTSASTTDLMSCYVGYLTGSATNVTWLTGSISAAGTSIILRSMTAAAASLATNNIFTSSTDLGINFIYETT